MEQLKLSQTGRTYVPAKPQTREHNEQTALFQWAAYNVGKYPELALMYAIPNGGKRDGRTGAILKAEGVKAGVPDIHLPVARGIHPGMFIEMKVGSNKPTELQLWWINRLREQGYAVGVYYDWEAARDAIVDYLKGKPYKEIMQEVNGEISAKYNKTGGIGK